MCFKEKAMCCGKRWCNIFKILKNKIIFINKCWLFLKYSPAKPETNAEILLLNIINKCVIDKRKKIFLISLNLRQLLF